MIDRQNSTIHWIPVGNLVSAFGVIPEPADVFDEFAVVIDQHVVDGDYTLVALFGGRVLLQQFEPPLVERRHIPIGLREEPVQAGLVGGFRELGVDSGDGFIVGDHQPREVLGEVLPLGFAGKQVAEIFHGVLYHLGKRDNCWHDPTLPGLCAPLKITKIRHIIAYFSNAV